MSEEQAASNNHKEYDWSDKDFYDAIHNVANDDAKGLVQARTHYGDSWKRRGGSGAFHNLARKWDRIERLCEQGDYDIFKQLEEENEQGRSEQLIDSVRDLRRYLMLVEQEMVLRGTRFPLQRDNKTVTKEEAEYNLGLMEDVAKFNSLATTPRRDKTEQENPFGYDRDEDSLPKRGNDTP